MSISPSQGADHVLLFTEHSPKVTGIQPIEDVLPVVRQNPQRFHPVANLNPHLHYPVAAELARQVDLGAIAVKIHPVHGGFEARDRMLYPAYAWAEERGLPVIVHCGTSTFAGSVNSYADPILLDEVFRDFPDLVVVLAHGGRGWWYDQAAFLALMKPNVWLEVSGLPPQRLASYYGSALRAAGRQDDLRHRLAWRAERAAERRVLEKTLLEAGCTDDQVTAALGGNAAESACSGLGFLTERLARHPTSLREYIMQAEVVVIGAGALGLSTALHCAIAGRSVIVVERADSGLAGLGPRGRAVQVRAGRRAEDQAGQAKHRSGGQLRRLGRRPARGDEIGQLPGRENRRARRVTCAPRRASPPAGASRSVRPTPARSLTASPTTRIREHRRSRSGARRTSTSPSRPS